MRLNYMIYFICCGLKKTSQRLVLQRQNAAVKKVRLDSQLEWPKGQFAT